MLDVGSAMFNKKLIEKLEQEIQFLRDQVINLQDQVIVLANKANEYRAVVHTKEAVEYNKKVSTPDIIKKIQDMEADTKEEKEQKEEALNDLREMFRV